MAVDTAPAPASAMEPQLLTQLTFDSLISLTTSDRFFKPCDVCLHKSSGRDAVVNFFDVTAGEPACSLCLTSPSRLGHRFLQIRRSSYHDVAKLTDLAKVGIQVTGIQPYVINSSKVVFLQRRPVVKGGKGGTKGAVGPAQCRVCTRHLQDLHLYCSLQCKLDVLHAEGLTAPPSVHQQGSAATSGPVSLHSPPGTPSRGPIEERGSSQHTSSSLEEGVSATSRASSRQRKSSPKRSPLQ